MFDAAFAYVKVMASSLGEKAKGVLVNVSAFADGDDEATAEGATDEPLWGALGVVSRPRPPDASGHAEAIAARAEAGLRPLATRDLRITRARGNVREGATGIAGYGGGFVSIDDAPAGGGSIMTVYVPYAFDGKGVPSKALAITLDTTPGSESVVVAHASGAAVVMTHTGELVLRSDTGEARIVLKGDTITLQAAKVVAQGNVVLGANPIGAVPLAAPGAMSPSVFVSAV